jgi:hypothetical protein
MTTQPIEPRRRGFAIPGNASKAATKGHQLGKAYCHEWTGREALEAGLKAAKARRFAGAYKRAGVPA